MSNTQKVVHLRIYSGKRMSFDEAGTPQNPNQIVKLIHETLSWNNYLKHMDGCCRVLVEKYFEDGDEKKIPNEIVKEVNFAFTGKEDIEAPKAEVKEEAPAKEAKAGPDDDLIAARAEYMEAFGKKGHHSWDVDKINAKIKDKENE